MLSKPILPVLDYALNYDYISNELCENKEKPELKCNGKCHLMKSLADATESENAKFPIEKKQHNSIEILFLEPISSFQFKLPIVTSQKNNFFYTTNYSRITSSTFFRPPIC